MRIPETGRALKGAIRRIKRRYAQTITSVRREYGEEYLKEERGGESYLNTNRLNMIDLLKLEEDLELREERLLRRMRRYEDRLESIRERSIFRLCFDSVF